MNASEGQLRAVWRHGWRANAEIIWTCAEEGQWMYWTKDLKMVLPGRRRRGDNRKDSWMYWRRACRGWCDWQRHEGRRKIIHCGRSWKKNLVLFIRVFYSKLWSGRCFVFLLHQSKLSICFNIVWPTQQNCAVRTAAICSKEIWPGQQLPPYSKTSGKDWKSESIPYIMLTPVFTNHWKNMLAQFSYIQITINSTWCDWLWLCDRSYLLVIVMEWWNNIVCLHLMFTLN